MLPTLSQDAFFTQFGDQVRYFKSTTGLGIHYSIDGPLLKIGFLGPFWQFDSTGVLDFEAALTETFRELASLQDRGNILVRSPPDDLYPLESSVVAKALRSLGFSLDYTEIDHFAILQGDPEAMLSRTNQKKVRRGASLGYTFEVGVEWLQASHEVILSNRLQMGKPSAISLASKQQLSLSLGQRTTYGVVRVGQQILAGMFCFFLDDEVAYVAQWGDDRDLISLRNLESPMPFLFVELAKFLRHQGVKRLYLGTSSTLGALDPGLARFKESLGCQRTNKRIWRLGD
jgi:hypothetical protein